jgi:hypothetical protein
VKVDKGDQSVLLFKESNFFFFFFFFFFFSPLLNPFLFSLLPNYAIKFFFMIV